jgi:GTP cyclohydrolase I
MAKSIKKVNDDSKMLIIEDHFREIMFQLGLDLENPELKETPRRVAKMYVKEIFSGLDKDNEPKMTVFPNVKKYDQLIALTNIKAVSMCAHHFMPYDVSISIAYIPGNNYVGISKLVRTVKYFSRKPSTQEILVAEISEFLQEKLKPLGLMVYCEGKHYCMVARGVEMPSAIMITSELKGLFRENLTLEEKFLNMIKK